MTSPTSAATPGSQVADAAAWDAKRAAIASHLAALTLSEEPLAPAVDALREALAADRAVLEVRAPRLRVELPVQAPGEPSGAASSDPRTFEILAGDRWLGTISFWSRTSGRSSDEANELAQLLVPLLLLEESRLAASEARTAGSDQLAEQERFISMIVDSLPLGLYVVDRDYRIRLWSRGREEGLQGVAREEALGQSIFDVLHRQPAEKLKKELDHVMQSGEIIRFEAESTAVGEARSYRLSRIPMRFNGDAVSHVIAIGEDITDWKQAQLRTMRAEKLAAVGQLAAGVMHEVNNPLATIGACAETISVELAAGSTPDAGTLRELVGIIEHEVHRCRRLVDDLLGFSRQSSAERAPLELEQLVDETFTLLAHHSRFKRARVRRERPDAALGLVHGSREQLMQVFMALLLNAVDAIAGGGEVVVAAGVNGDAEVALTVRDTGSGIAPSELPRIFEPFYSTKPPGQGTGLGLAISYGIISDHAGRIEVESQLGQGSSFRVVLPVWEGE